jgi:hypothetical protein
MELYLSMVARLFCLRLSSSGQVCSLKSLVFTRAYLHQSTAIYEARRGLADFDLTALCVPILNDVGWRQKYYEQLQIPVPRGILGFDFLRGGPD